MNLVCTYDIKYVSLNFRTVVSYHSISLSSSFGADLQIQSQLLTPSHFPVAFLSLIWHHILQTVSSMHLAWLAPRDSAVHTHSFASASQSPDCLPLSWHHPAHNVCCVFSPGPSSSGSQMYFSKSSSEQRHSFSISHVPLECPATRHQYLHIDSCILQDIDERFFRAIMTDGLGRAKCGSRVWNGFPWLSQF